MNMDSMTPASVDQTAPIENPPSVSPETPRTCPATDARGAMNRADAESALKKNAEIIRVILRKSLGDIRQPIYTDLRVGEIFQYANPPSSVIGPTFVLGHHPVAQFPLIADPTAADLTYNGGLLRAFVVDLAYNLDAQGRWERFLRRPNRNYALMRRVSMDDESRAIAKRYITMNNFLGKLSLTFDPSSGRHILKLESIYGIGKSKD